VHQGGHRTSTLPVVVHQFAEPIRLLCLAGGLLWIAWLVLFTRSVVRVEKQRPTG
jgi:hypothetical protein